MNYHHGYHAGNFADVFKHLVLIALLESLLRKDKSLFYLETHAGGGHYNLSSGFARKTHEFKNGIEKIMNITSDNIPPIVQKYRTIVQDAGYPTYYPGSPLIAHAILRSQDRMGLIELQHEEAVCLKNIFKREKNVAVHHQDGYQGIKAFLPPEERRGLIVIDPPFEDSTEWKQILTAIKMGMQKFPSGVYAVWYPIKDLRAVKKFLNAMAALRLPNALSIEFDIYPQDASLNLIGCGMLIINSPWKLDAELKAWLPWVWGKLTFPSARRVSINFL